MGIILELLKLILSLLISLRILWYFNKCFKRLSRSYITVLSWTREITFLWKKASNFTEGNILL